MATRSASTGESAHRRVRPSVVKLSSPSTVDNKRSPAPSAEVDAWAFLHSARVDPGPPPISSIPNRTAPIGSSATYGDDADLDNDLDLDLPPSRTHTLVKRALASGCYYTCPATTKPNGLNAALPLVSGSKYPRCEYFLGGLAGGGTCTYSTTDGKLTSSSGAGVAGNCQDNASTQCAAGSRSLTVRRQEEQRERDEEAERKRPSRRLKEGKVPEELEARFGLWKMGRRGRLGEGSGSE